MADGEILINTKIQTDEAKADLKDLQKDLKDTADSASESNKKLESSMAESVSSLPESYQTAFKKIEQIRADDAMDSATKADKIAEQFESLGQSSEDSLAKSWGAIKHESESGSQIVIDNLEEIAQEAAQAGKSMSGIGSGMGGGMGGLVAGFIGGLTSTLVQEGLDILKQAGQAMLDFGKESIKLASDLQETQNVVDVTFKTMSDDVDEFARNAIKSAGMSETTAKKYTGTFGAMAKSFGFTEKEAYDMATSLTQLTGDVASFYNLDHDEANTKLKAVFTGETEALKELGVVMTQAALDQYALQEGYGKTTAEMTEQEKVALRYAFVTDQLSDASGDFVRTQDSWANQTKILSEQWNAFQTSIGEGLLEVFTPFVSFLNNAIMPGLLAFGDWFSDFMTDDPVEQLSDSFDDLGISMDETITKADGTVAAYDDVKAAIEGIEATVESLKLEYDEAREAAKEFLDSQIGLLTELDDSAKREEDIRKREVEMQKQEAELMSKINEAEAEMNKKISEAIAEGNYKKSNELTDSYSKKVESLTKQLSELKEENRQTLQELRDQSRTTAQEIVDIWKNQYSALTNYAKNMRKAMDMGLDKALVQQLSDGSQESMMILNELVNGTDASVEEINRAFAEVEQAKNTVSAVMADVQTDMSNKLNDLSRKTRDEWGDMADTVGRSIREMQDYIDSLEGKTVYIDVVNQVTTGTGVSSGSINNPFSYYSLEPDAVPQLATGAVIPPNAPFTAVLGDQRNGYNLEGPEDMFRGIVREELENTSNSETPELLRELIAVVSSLSIDGQSLFDIVVDRNNLAVRSYGTSPLTR